MLHECVEHLKGNSSLETTEFVLYDQASLEVFESVWREMQLKSGKRS